MGKALKIVTINLAVLVGLLALLEGGSWAVLRVNDWRIAAVNEELREEERPGEDKGEIAFYSTPGVTRDLDARREMWLSPYDYVAYLTYENRPFESEFFNVGDDGFRVNGQEIDKEAARTYRIWMLGSSAVYGVTNADSETIPANLERILNERYPDVRVEVLNRGVVGYLSLQDLVSFRIGLMDAVPDMVISFNGANDHIYAWNRYNEETGYLDTGVNSGVLAYYWDMHARRGLVNWPMLGARLRGLFGNTLELMPKIGKFFALRTARGDIEAFKARYRERVATKQEEAERIVPKSNAIFVANERAIVDIAQSSGIDAILTQQPSLVISTKPRVGTEFDEYYHGLLSYFAMPAEELAALEEVESWHIDKQGYWSLGYYREMYRQQNAMLRALAAETGAGYVDMQALVDGLGETPVFASPIHYTYIATEIMAEALADEIARMDPPKLTGGGGSG